MTSHELEDLPPLAAYRRLHNIFVELQATIQSRESQRAELANHYESQLATLREENRTLSQENAKAILVRQAQDQLNPDDDDEDYDYSPILEEKVLNLQETLKRLRLSYGKKEARYQRKIDELEKVILIRMEKILELERAKLGSALPVDLSNLDLGTQPRPPSKPSAEGAAEEGGIQLEVAP